ncbi:MAG: ABC transporter ATP-binding protein [Desulfomonilaceae bacterium]|nr:ABC transporter ATP-binding protein [Desulfomonilaceae bacterium]
MKDKLDRFMLWRAVKLVWESAPGWTAVNLVAILVLGLLPLGAVYVMKLVVDAVTDAIGGPAGQAHMDSILFLVAISGALILTQVLVSSAANVVKSIQSQLVTDRLASIIQDKAVAVDMECYDNPDYYDKLHRAEDEVAFRPNRVVDGLVELARNTISLLAMAGLLFSFHVGLAAAVLIACVPDFLVRLKLSEKLYAWFRQNTTPIRLANFFHWMLTKQFHVKEMRVYGLGSTLMNRFEKIRSALRQDKFRLVARYGVFEMLAGTVTVAAYLAAYIFIVYRTVAGAITLGDMVMYYQAFQLAQDNFKNLMRSIALLFEDSLFISSLYDFLHWENKVKEPARPKALPNAITSGISLESVSFRYPGRGNEVLENVTLNMQPGRITALVGENGSGKTTLLKLLCRFYDPTGGSICIDGQDFKSIRREDLWKSMGVIFQDYSKYPVTVRENVSFGACHVDERMDRVVEAASEATAHAMIMNLRRQYDTVLSNYLEGGQELSEGEWQKMALARALYNRGQILLLDEPTSSMDAKSARRFLAQLKENSNGRVVLLISHDLSTVGIADWIYLLDHGRIVEMGTYEQLLEKRGRFWRLFSTSAS